MSAAEALKAPLLAPAVELIKLDLACGNTPREGFVGVDNYAAEAKHKVNLMRYPWPWKDSSVDEIHCSHYIEHIPAHYVDRSGLWVDPASVEPGGDIHDAWLLFFEECYRILKPGGLMTVICPCARSNRAFQDPTHRRFIVAEDFYYLSKEWRAINKLEHGLYDLAANFRFSADPGIPQDLTLLSPEAQQRRFNESWNTVLDWHVKLYSLKEESKK